MTLRHYESYICDSARWEGFEHRRGDIVVTTPPKCGTTWMQMCCLVLVHGATLPDRLSSLAPWPDQTVARIDEVRALFEAQPHRRVIKTHTPLDGLPLSDLVTYVAVGRDPRDVAFSAGDHFRNMDVDGLRRLKDAAGLDEGPPIRRPHPDDREEAFLQWVHDDTPVERFGSRLSCTVHHLRTVWARRHDVNVELFHYADMRLDPEGQLRRLAAGLDIDVPDDAWPALVEATSFESMKQLTTSLSTRALLSAVAGAAAGRSVGRGDIDPKLAGDGLGASGVLCSFACGSLCRCGSAIARLGPGLSCGSPGLGPFDLLEQVARLLFVSSAYPGGMVVASLKLDSVCCQLGIKGVLGRRRLLACAGNSGPKLLELS